MKIKIITGSRADWNGLGMVAKALGAFDVDVSVLAIAQHADSEESLSILFEDGFDARLVRTNFKDEMAIGAGSAMIAVRGVLLEDRPDCIVVLGDRFEIFGAVSAAALLNVPVAHIGGGDVTDGSIDNRLRYAMSALSDFHFVTNKRSQWQCMDAVRRDHGWVDGLLPDSLFNIHCVGNPALDRIEQTEIVSRETLFRAIGLMPSKRNVLVAYHAATTEPRPWETCMLMLEALGEIHDTSFLVLGTNADTGSNAINDLLAQFCDGRTDRIWKGNLPPEIFYSALAHFDCMVGNSSAGLVETAKFGIPVINIGPRQSGRAHARNVHTCGTLYHEIKYAVEIALVERAVPCPNPYGDGKSAERIASILVGALKKHEGHQT